ncbi:MAG: HAMP domain-containing histidine kinase [Flavisolibacter sp.]|nr:HAMP domain-containing histidine kinase [Flavisolibacter sp.]
MHQPFKHIRWMPLLMTLTILAIAGFQLYWLRKAYQREERTLEIRTNSIFRETVHSLQASKLKLDKLMVDSLPQKVRITYKNSKNEENELKAEPRQKIAAMVTALSERAEDESRGDHIILREKDSTRGAPNYLLRKKQLMRFLYDLDELQDSVTVREIRDTFSKRIAQQNIEVPFTISRLQKPKSHEKGRIFNEVTLGFRNPITYRLDLGDTTAYVVKRISAPILLSVFLVAFTIVSFTLLYRNLLRQRRLAVIKNEFISNITHELKTPIATVSVAIEALRSFNANMDARKTKEYLDISANELQRLSLLVDKVLKLSMFENKEVELKYELLDMKALVNEVAASLRLQFEKYGAHLSVASDGDTQLEGDRLHLVSVIYNLLDNALKYSTDAAQVDVAIKGGDQKITLCIRDNGIGIPAAYKDRIFEKFFRVPTGNLHNAKGYGLGLSYVAHVVQKHGGTIEVDSAEGKGSQFIITLPKYKV